MAQHAIRSTTRLVGLIGWPVSHSLSPRLHNAAYAALGLDWAYLPLPVAPERVGDALRGLQALGFAGANVTVPHKEAVLPFLDELTPAAQAIGAVNTIIVRPDGSLLGDNTDGAGFLADLEEQGVKGFRTSRAGIEASAGPSGRQEQPAKASTPGESLPIHGESRVESVPTPVSSCPRVTILGAGGAARAIAYALLTAGASVAVANRTLERAERLCHALALAVPEAANRLSAHPWPAALSSLAEEAELIVNATSLGLREGDPLPWDPAVAFRPGQVVYDTIYNRPTELLALARTQGARAINGLGMLIEQAARSAALWTGKDASLFSEIMRKDLLAS
ncbi:MAG: shikimate dehydrogenase family protein [Anaerolineae bacterium]